MGKRSVSSNNLGSFLPWSVEDFEKKLRQVEDAYLNHEGFKGDAFLTCAQRVDQLSSLFYKNSNCCESILSKLEKNFARARKDGKLAQPLFLIFQPYFKIDKAKYIEKSDEEKSSFSQAQLEGLLERIAKSQISGELYFNNVFQNEQDRVRRIFERIKVLNQLAGNSQLKLKKPFDPNDGFQLPIRFFEKCIGHFEVKLGDPNMTMTTRLIYFRVLQSRSFRLKKNSEKELDFSQDNYKRVRNLGIHLIKMHPDLTKLAPLLPKISRLKISSKNLGAKLPKKAMRDVLPSVKGSQLPQSSETDLSEKDRESIKSITWKTLFQALLENAYLQLNKTSFSSYVLPSVPKDEFVIRSENRDVKNKFVQSCYPDKLKGRKIEENSSSKIVRPERSLSANGLELTSPNKPRWLLKCPGIAQAGVDRRRTSISGPSREVAAMIAIKERAEDEPGKSPPVIVSSINNAENDFSPHMTKSATFANIASQTQKHLPVKEPPLIIARNNTASKRGLIDRNRSQSIGNNLAEFALADIDETDELSPSRLKEMNKISNFKGFRPVPPEQDRCSNESSDNSENATPRTSPLNTPSDSDGEESLSDGSDSDDGLELVLPQDHPAVQDPTSYFNNYYVPNTYFSFGPDELKNSENVAERRSRDVANMIASWLILSKVSKASIIGAENSEESYLKSIFSLLESTRHTAMTFFAQCKYSKMDMNTSQLQKVYNQVLSFSALADQSFPYPEKHPCWHMLSHLDIMTRKLLNKTEFSKKKISTELLEKKERAKIKSDGYPVNEAEHSNEVMTTLLALFKVYFFDKVPSDFSEEMIYEFSEVEEGLRDEMEKIISEDKIMLNKLLEILMLTRLEEFSGVENDPSFSYRGYLLVCGESILVIRRRAMRDIMHSHYLYEPVENLSRMNSNPKDKQYYKEIQKIDPQLLHSDNLNEICQLELFDPAYTNPEGEKEEFLAMSYNVFKKKEKAGKCMPTPLEGITNFIMDSFDHDLRSGNKIQFLPASPYVSGIKILG